MFEGLARKAIRAQLSITDRASAVTRRIREDEGASAVEYALMVGLIAVVIIVAVTALGGNLRDRFSSVASSV